MEQIAKFFDFIKQLFIWWVIVSPWEQGVQVRFGKHVKLLEAGTHFNMPFFYRTYVQNLRLRIVSTSVQTLTTKDNITLTIVAAIGYSIEDMLQVFKTITYPDKTIVNYVQGEIAQHIASTVIADCKPDTVHENVYKKLQELPYGLKIEYLRITGYAIVKTYRLIQDGHYMDNGSSLNTTLREP